eukprot:s1926_g4.t1
MAAWLVEAAAELRRQMAVACVACSCESCLGKALEEQMAVAAWLVEAAAETDACGLRAAPALAKAGADAPQKDLLYRQYDVPPSAYPDPVDYDEPTVTRLVWHLPTLPPDKTYRCTVEGRFETNTSVHWWTPLMKSGPFVVERVPPPSPPELVPVAELPTPEQEKLLARLAPHSNAWLAVRWPWRVQGRHVDILKESSHVLEYCRSDALQSLRDPFAENLGLEMSQMGKPCWMVIKWVVDYFLVN